MTEGVVPLERADDNSIYGSKAVGLGAAARSGLPIPPGVALSGDVVEAVAGSDNASIEAVAALVRPLGAPLAVRSSAVEDGAEASFAGQHITLLNVTGMDAVADAVREVWWSANSDSAITYRQRVGLFKRPSVGVVVQSLLDPECAGVMFTRNPINGADERVIEASWGLGEAVVAGLVIPDHFRLDRGGKVLERTPGLKKIAVRTLPEGGTFEEKLSAELAEQLCSTTPSSMPYTNSPVVARRCTARIGTSSGRSPTASCSYSSAVRSPGRALAPMRRHRAERRSTSYRTCGCSPSSTATSCSRSPGCSSSDASRKERR